MQYYASSSSFLLILCCRLKSTGDSWYILNLRFPPLFHTSVYTHAYVDWTCLLYNSAFILSFFLFWYIHIIQLSRVFNEIYEMNEGARTCARIKCDDLYMSLRMHTMVSLSVCMHCVLLYGQEGRWW